jgi:hypothetical protein
VRKRLAVDPAVGLGVESTLVLPLAVGYLAVSALHGGGAIVRGDGAELSLLSLGGPITVIPWFASPPPPCACPQRAGVLSVHRTVGDVPAGSLRLR